MDPHRSNTSFITIFPPWKTSRFISGSLETKPRRWPHAYVRTGAGGGCERCGLAPFPPKPGSPLLPARYCVTRRAFPPESFGWFVRLERCHVGLLVWGWGGWVSLCDASTPDMRFTVPGTVGQIYGQGEVRNKALGRATRTCVWRRREAMPGQSVNPSTPPPSVSSP